MKMRRVMKVVALVEVGYGLDDLLDRSSLLLPPSILDSTAMKSSISISRGSLC